MPLPSERIEAAAVLVAVGGRAAGWLQMPERYRAMVLVGAYAGLRWGEAAGLTRRNVDVLRSRIRVTTYGGRGPRSCDARSGAQDAAIAANGAGRPVGDAPGRGAP